MSNKLLQYEHPNNSVWLKSLFYVFSHHLCIFDQLFLLLSVLFLTILSKSFRISKFGNVS